MRGLTVIRRTAAFAALALASAAAAADFKVVVHPENRVESIARSELSALFLKKVKRWRGGAPVIPVETAVAGVREHFCAAVHGKRIGSVKAYWNQVIFSGRDVPPLEKRSDDEVIAFVRTHPNAIGLVSIRASADGVKVLRVTD